jgi:hypothetical protein
MKYIQMKNSLTLLLLLVLNQFITKGQTCASINSSNLFLVANPQKASYCVGNNISFNVSTSFVLNVGSLVWSYSGSVNSTFPSGNSYQLNSVQTGGIVTVNGSVTISSNTCPFTRTFNVSTFANTLVANAGSDKIYTSTAVALGNPPNCSTGGASPYTYLWTPNTGFTGGTNNTQCAPMVIPSAYQTTYMLTVTDANGCSSSDNMLVSNFSTVNSYIVPKKTLDGGYQIPKSNFVYFKFEEEYRTSTISYKILDYTQATPNTAPINISCTNLTGSLKSLGDNRYSISLPTCSPVLSPGKFYVVELTNDKNEKFYFKFLN